jgi:S-methylmethionine-dependent homocysteine/selenocysteine methylase
VVIEASIGPRSHAYQPSLVMDADEAVGITRAATAVGPPIHIGFTVETDGRLPSGESIEEAIIHVDDATAGAATSFMIDCAHPTHFDHALPEGDSRRRIAGLRANASTLSHAELDESDELESGDPDDLAERYVALRRDLPGLEIVGGCCGTDIRHATAICDVWLAADGA